MTCIQLYDALRSKDNIFIDNDYLKQYCELITDNRCTKRQKFKTQKHHIIPAVFYKIKKIPCNNDPDNLINLLYKDHILAHYYLCLCTKKEFHIAMYNAMNFIIGRKYQLDSSNDLKSYLSSLDHYQDIYEEHKQLLSSKQTGAKRPHSGIKISKANKGRPKDKKWRENLSKAHKGKKFSLESRKKMSESAKKRIRKPLSEETKKKISEARRGKKQSEETRKKLSALHKGKPAWNKGLTGVIKTSEQTRKKLSISLMGKNKDKVYIYKDNITKHVNKKDIDIYLNNGWNIGKPISSINHKGTKWLHNDTSEIKVKKENISSYISKGYKLGRLKRR